MSNLVILGQDGQGKQLHEAEGRSISAQPTKTAEVTLPVDLVGTYLGKTLYSRE